MSLSSVGSTRVQPNYVAVGASKAAIETLTRYFEWTSTSFPGRFSISHRKIVLGVLSKEILDQDGRTCYTYIVV